MADMQRIEAFWPKLFSKPGSPEAWIRVGQTMIMWATTPGAWATKKFPR